MMAGAEFIETFLSECHNTITLWTENGKGQHQKTHRKRVLHEEILPQLSKSDGMRRPVSGRDAVYALRSRRLRLFLAAKRSRDGLRERLLLQKTL
jgi:hypothetical protein